jgi:hypothetical protein
MIKKFKIFEKSYYGEDLIDELLAQLSDNDIDEYYSKNYKTSLHDILSNWCSEESIIPSVVSNFFDDKKYMEDYIDQIKRETSLSDFDKDNYKSFIEDNLTTKKEEKIIEIYNDNYYYGDEDILSEVEGIASIIELKNGTTKIKITSGKKTKTYVVPDDFHSVVENGEHVDIGDVILTGKSNEYDSDMLDELDDEELRDVIEDDDEEDKFIDYMVYVEEDDAEEIIKNKCYKRSRYSWGDAEFLTGHDLVDKVESEISDYVDEEAMLKSYSDNEDFEYKKDTTKGDIATSKFLQKRILKNKKSNIIKLIEYLSETSHSDTNIMNEYKYQKMYILEYIKKQTKKNTRKEKPINEEKMTAKALQFIDENFEIHPDIMTEYSKNWYISTKKYNM